MVITPTQEQAEWKGSALKKKGNTMRMNSARPILWCNPSALKRGEIHKKERRRRKKKKDGEVVKEGIATKTSSGSGS